MPADEAYHLPPTIEDSKVPTATLRKLEEDVTYTSQDAAEFVRRGACMVVWPEEEGK